jgi:hypothetical protein
LNQQLKYALETFRRGYLRFIQCTLLVDALRLVSQKAANICLQLISWLVRYTPQHAMASHHPKLRFASGLHWATCLAG